MGETKQKFPTLRAVSMDKGFHSPANQEVLESGLECVVLPQKGRLSRANKACESKPEFVDLRKKHSAVESAINALEVHGLDQCPEHGLKGFNLSKQRLILSTLCDLNAEEIYIYYTKRCSIEDLFNQVKNKWGWRETWRNHGLTIENYHSKAKDREKKDSNVETTIAEEASSVSLFIWDERT